MPFSFSKSRLPSAGINVLAVAAATVSAGVIFFGSPRTAMACGPESYIGSVCTFASNFCPRDFLPANGAILAISSNSALFALLGTTYGGNGTSTFALPNLQSRSVVGSGQGQGLNPVTLGEPVGQSNATLLAQNLPPHTHPATFNGTGGGGSQTVTIPATTGNLAVNTSFQGRVANGAGTISAGAFFGNGGSGGGGANIYVPSTSTADPIALGGVSANLTGTAGTPELTFSVNSGITGGTVTVQPNSGGPVPFSIQSPGLGLTQCILVNGLFPPRP
ncbi:phage tail protein [Neorhizobium sp. NPDC001467]|uniref:phage tail protein n=1 Tax=Neorhizobium sp. NPDC001467 TaxID=3390595 RepID=UPI003CFCD0DF